MYQKDVSMSNSEALQYLQYVQPLHHVRKHSSRHANMLDAMAQ